MPLGIDFWEDFGGFCKMEPSWHQNRTKNPCEHRNAILRKSCSHCSGGSNFLDSEVQVGSKNRSKIDEKMRSTWEGILASIFDRFWWILGAKLGGKIEPKSIKNGIEKTMKKRRATRWPKSRNSKSKLVGARWVQTPREGPPL